MNDDKDKIFSWSVEIPVDYQWNSPFSAFAPPTAEQTLFQQAREANTRGLEFLQARMFVEALQCFEQAIAIREQLPKDNPEYQYVLLGAYVNCGLAQNNLSFHKEALTSCDKAIAIYEQFLPKDNSEYFPFIANAYNNRGLAQYDLRDFTHAIESYDQAIKIREPPPKDNPEYQRDLAGAYNNRGNAQSKLPDLTHAIESYDQAIQISELLPKENPEHQNHLALVYNGRAVAYLASGETAKANDDAVMGLDILRDLEKRGIYWYRETREILFNTTIDTYLALRSVEPLLELLEEHLDPDVPGSAPQSDAMHAAALRGLRRLYSMAYNDYPELLADIERTTAKLTEIRSRYFIGTVAGARLTAQYYEENAEDLVRAEAILKQYTEKVPSDPQGYTQLAEFYHRRGDNIQAQANYEQAILHTLGNPALETPQTVEQLIKIVGYLVFGEPSTAAEAQANLKKVRLWQRDFTRIPDTLAYREKLLDPAFEASYAKLEDMASKENIREAVQEAVQKTRATDQELLRRALNALPHKWRTVLEILLNAQRQVWEEHGARYDQATESDRATILQEMADTLTRSLEGQISRIADLDLANAYAKLQTVLGDSWPRLTPEEQKNLATGYHLWQEEFFNFAALGFGLAVEKSLLARLFAPLRQWLAAQKYTLPCDDKDWVGNYLNGKGYLMLGNLVRAFNDTFHPHAADTPKTSTEVKNLLKQVLSYSPATDSARTRREALFGIKNLRNDGAHQSKTLTPAEITRLFTWVVEDVNHAFFRYFTDF